jgi:hypothetical protein
MNGRPVRVWTVTGTPARSSGGLADKERTVKWFAGTTRLLELSRQLLVNNKERPWVEGKTENNKRTE